jgi:hypothetical protein
VVLSRSSDDRTPPGIVVRVVRPRGLAPIAAGAEKGNPLGRPLAADASGYPGGMLAFMRKKFVGSYLALRAVSRVHWLSVYA